MFSSSSRCVLRVSRGKVVSTNYTNYANRSRTYASKTISNDGISLWYPVVGGFVITVAGGIKYTQDHFGGTEGLNRAISFYKIAIPKYVEYRWHMFRESPDDTWDQLHEETSKSALEKMLELEGFYIKTGQMCAANIGNAFPKIWQETMAILQDQVPHKSFDVVKEVIEVDMGRPLNEVFASFETKPIGSASIGQVHRATLLDGTHVVVKVMYPHVERLFRGDVRTIKLFAQLAQPVHVPALEEIEKQFMTEFDYRAEAVQLAQVRENLTKAGLAGDSSTKLCVIPRPYLDLCTKRVLVMEELKGDKLAVALMKDAQRHAERAGQSVEEFLAEQQAKEKEAKALGLEYQGPSATQMATYISLLNHQRQLSNAWSLLHNVTVGWIPGFKLREYKGKDVLPINHAKMVDDLIYVHGWEVLVDGYFNGDPHPGNILLLGVEEGKPKLGLIDYGQVKKLPDATRLLFSKLVIALADDNRADIVRLMKEAGYKSKYMDAHNIYLYARVGYDEDNDELTGGKHIQLFMEDLQSRDPILELPKDLLMASRASILLRGLAHVLHQRRSIAKAWKPIAEKVLENEST